MRSISLSPSPPRAVVTREREKQGRWKLGVGGVGGSELASGVVIRTQQRPQQPSLQLSRSLVLSRSDTLLSLSLPPRVVGGWMLCSATAAAPLSLLRADLHRELARRWHVYTCSSLSLLLSRFILLRFLFPLSLALVNLSYSPLDEGCGGERERERERTDTDEALVTWVQAHTHTETHTAMELPDFYFPYYLPERCVCVYVRCSHTFGAVSRVCTCI